MRTFTMRVISLAAASCIGSSVYAAPAGDYKMVYINNGSIQCESKGLAPATTAQTLIDHDIEVMQSQCGRLSGMAVAAQCGLGDININIHTINTDKLAGAEALGFQPVATLKNDSGAGYTINDCRE